MTKSAYTVSDPLTPLEAITKYNNYYEFGTDKDDPAMHAGKLKTRPWQVKVEGEVKKQKVYDIDELLKLAPLEERVYRMRCVEGWSMVIPWVGFPLAELIKRVEPTGNAKFIEFVTLLDPAQMPGQGRARAAVAVCGRPAHGRSHASVDAAHARPLRPKRCRTRTARPCGWWCHGNTGSRALRRS